jgi:prepilin-type N-terminal cleavage/methylation domain-containing protein
MGARHSSWFEADIVRRLRSHPGGAIKYAQNHGFTLLELVVVVIIISIAAVIALQHLMAVRVDAERAAITRMVGNLRSGIGMHVARSVLDDNWAAIAALDGANPMALMAQVPDSYLGELSAPDPSTVAAQRWYFDSGQGLLVYRVQFGEYFESTLDTPARARFKLKLLYADKNGNGRFDRGVDEFDGAELVAAEPFRWLSEAKGNKGQHYGASGAGR